MSRLSRLLAVALTASIGASCARGGRKPPVPLPPAPPPAPVCEAVTPAPVSSTTTLRASDGHYVTAENGGCGPVVANRADAGPWETFAIEHVGINVAFRTADGHYLTAEGGGGAQLSANRANPGPWEQFTPVQTDGGWAFRTADGQHFLRAEGGGGQEVNAAGPDATIWQAFAVSASLAGGPVRGAGILRFDGLAFVDDTGDIIPVSIHLGDLFWRFTQDPASVDGILGHARDAGYSIVRSWAILNDRADRGNPFWGYLACGPRSTPDWKGQMAAFARKLASYGLRWHLSLGGYDGLSEAQLRAAYSDIADVMGDVGPQWFVVPGEINEAHFNADGHGPAFVESLVNIIRGRFPQNLYALSHVMGTEDAGELKPWTPAWMSFYAIGGSDRSPAQAWYDLAHHNFGDGYEGPSTVIRRDAMEFEGDDRPDINAAQWGIIKAALAIARITPNVFLPGSARFQRDGDPSDNPAFWSVPALVNKLPRDLFRFASLEHIGDPAGRPWRRPISNCGEGTRGEYTRDPGTGRFVLIVYLNGGRPGTYSCHVDNGFTATVIPPDHPDQSYDVDLNAGQAFQFTTATGVVVSGHYK